MKQKALARMKVAVVRLFQDFCLFVNLLTLRNCTTAKRLAPVAVFRRPTSFYSITNIRGGGGGKDSSIDDVEEPMKSCRCVLCGQEIIANSQEDCEKHMEICPAFARVHPLNGTTNPEGVYPPSSSSSETKVQELQQPKDIENMSVKELRRIILQAGLSDSDCIEKKELQARAREAMELQNQ